MRSNVRGRDNNFVVTLPAVMSLGNWQLLGLDQIGFPRQQRGNSETFPSLELDMFVPLKIESRKHLGASF